MPEERPRWRRSLDAVLSIGALPGETETRRSARHVVILGMIVGTLLSIPTSVSEITAGYTWAGVPDLASVAFVPLLLWIVWRRPGWFNAGVTLFFIASFASGLVDTALFGGLFGSGLIPVFGLLYVIGALLVIGTRAALWWFAAFVASIVYAVAVPHWIDPLYHRTDRVTEAATNIVALGIVVVLVLAYFVRQRDRFQQRSDDLLHSILPGPIVERLKDEPGMIADDVPAATVLFADVVGFTPMSAGMTPAELVSLLNEVFATIDGFVEELGLEKIKTVGDEYMVAAGVPTGQADHAQRAAALALRIQEHFSGNDVRGRRLTFRVGINSGPLTSGIIGTHKFAYDLWGDTVNVASRMESGGVAGSIQISQATYDLIVEEYVCKPRGLIEVKGKGEMQTYLLLGRRGEGPAATEAPSSVPTGGGWEV